MEIRKYVIFLSTLIGTLWVPILVFAYANQTTHPALTDEAIDLFNNYYTTQKISNEDKDLIKKGSVEEDEAPRWLNHFYDPIHNNGLWGYDSSKVYAQAWPNILSTASVKPLSLDGQFVWQRAIYDYTYGNKNYAMLALGHVLHLIEDKAVPDHTRNDAHPPYFDQESPYEKWASKFNDSNITTATDLIKDNLPPIILGKLDNYFDDLANHSNKNFFSKDTILSKNYTEPKIDFEKTIKLSNGNNYLFGFSKESLALTKINKERNIITGEINKSYEILDYDNLINSSYWSHLSPQAVRYSAGVIKLFFDEVEKEKQNKILLSRNRSYTELAADKIKSTASAAFSFLKNNLNFSINKNVLTSSVVNISEEISEQNNALEFIEIIVPPTPTPKEEKKLPVETKEKLQNNSVPTPSPIAPQPPPANLFSVSLPYPGFGGGGYIAPVTVNTNGDSQENPENVSETILPEIVTEETKTGTSTPEEIIILDETPPVTPATSTPAEGVEATTTPEKIILPEPLSVIINEVAWAGTSATTANDEWIELYNNTSEEINLNGWILYSATDMGPYINLTGTISAKSFYLIERTDDNTVSDITADWAGSFGSGLSNGGESLVLSFASTTIDQTYVCGVGSNKWPPCSDYKYYTMERRDSKIPGTEVSNWGHATYANVVKNGKTSTREQILGTPKARNSLTYLINKGSQNMTQDITLTKENSPYLISGSWLFIKNGATLKIEPGVIIKFYNDGNVSGITVVDGKILALGTNEEKIIFTSYYDDEYGGDTDNSPLTEPWNKYGKWGGIGIYAPGTILDNVLIRSGAGNVYYGTPMVSHTALVVRNFPITLKNSTIEFSWYKGVELGNSNSTIENNIFQFNNHPAEKNSTGLITYGGNINLLSNKFLNNSIGLEITSSTGVIDGNIFEDNEINLKTSNAQVIFTNNVGIDNDQPPEPIIILESELETATSTATSTEEIF